MTISVALSHEDDIIDGTILVWCDDTQGDRIHGSIHSTMVVLCSVFLSPVLLCDCVTYYSPLFNFHLVWSCLILSSSIHHSSFIVLPCWSLYAVDKEQTSGWSGGEQSWSSEDDSPISPIIAYYIVQAICIAGYWRGCGIAILWYCGIVVITILISIDLKIMDVMDMILE